MDKRNLAIGVVVLVIVFLGFVFVSNMTGNVITGSIANEEIVVSDEFRIDEINDSVEEVLNESQNNSGSG